MKIKTIIQLVSVAGIFLLLLLWQKNTITQQKGAIALLEQSQKTLNANLKKANSTIAELRRLEKNRQHQQQQLQQKLATLEQTQSQRQQQTQEVHHAPQNIDWANKPLPDDVKRLRKRPYITTTEHYLQYLHNTQPMQPKSSSTTNQQPAKQPARGNRGQLGPMRSQGRSHTPMPPKGQPQ